METTLDAPKDETPVETPTADSPVQNQIDPFEVDESQFVSLTPEQRAALDPVLDKWKTTAKTTVEKAREAERKTFEPHVKKSQALENLIRDPEFVKWYQGRQRPPGQAPAPAAVASPQEWAEAVQAMANGDPAAHTALLARQFQAWAQPQVQSVQQEMQMLKAESEMTRLFSNHADAKDLDSIGRESDPTAPSLLELALHNVKDRMGGTMEQAYQVAKGVAQSMENKGKRAAMGLVDEKKKSMTEKPSVNSKEEGVIYVDTMEEAMSKNIEAAIDGRKVKYQVKK